MLFIVTKPPEFVAGFYRCSELSHEAAAELLNDNHKSGTCDPFIFHSSSQRALKELTEIQFEMKQKAKIPMPRDGDQFLHIKLKEKTSPGRPALSDHLFLLIDFSGK
jgi:hypothetical protein